MTLMRNSADQDSGKAPFLSVLLPVYNGSATLAECLTSVACQGQGIEVILVDQASTDESVAIAESFEGKLDMRIVSAPQNKNWVENTNLALSYAQAPFSTLLHQDDVWLPGRARLILRMKKEWPAASAWLHSGCYIDSRNKNLGRFCPPLGQAERLLTKDEMLQLLLVQNTVCLPAMMFPTKLAIDIGGLDEALWYTADWDFWLKLAAAGPIAWSPQNGVGFRLHPGSQTIMRSGNSDDFSSQLALPLERHLHQLPAGMRPATKSLAEVSNAMNVWLASRYHGQRPSIFPILRRIFGLGPIGMILFIKRTRILQRTLPRLVLK